jgi:hypothetical protein
VRNTNLSIAALWPMSTGRGGMLATSCSGEAGLTDFGRRLTFSLDDERGVWIMEDVAGVLTGLGIVGVGLTLLFGALFFGVLPWWAIIDCASSERHKNSRGLLVALLVFTWGFGSMIYGLFVTGSRGLRRFTVFSLFGSVLMFGVSTVACLTGAKMGHSAQMARIQAEDEARLAGFEPGVVSAGSVEPVTAIHFTHAGTRPQSAAVARFGLLGPEVASARNVDVGVRHVAHDPSAQRYYALTQHDFGTITPSSGHFTRIEVDPSVGQFSWPKGLAYDTARRQVVIMTSHVYTQFFRYDPSTADWSRAPAKLRDLNLVSLAYSPDEDCLYALEHGSSEAALRFIHRFNADGATVGAIELSPAIPIARRQTQYFQLYHSSGRLVLILPPLDPEAQRDSRVFVVDTETGQVSVSAS